jgi:hypothetical protein
MPVPLPLVPPAPPVVVPEVVLLPVGSTALELPVSVVLLLVLLPVEVGTSGSRSGSNMSRCLDTRCVFMNWDNSRRIGTST